MENLPIYVPVIFIATLLLGIWLFLKATGYTLSVILLLGAWIVLQSTLGVVGFYNGPGRLTTLFPVMVVGPPSLVLLSRFFTKGGRVFLDSLDVRWLTLYHIIRIPVEFVLLWLFIHHAIPQAMTFEGRNFDILSGLTAPLVYYFGFVKKTLPRISIILWNLACIALLLNVVSSAILSLPERFQRFGFEQPNIAVGYFPYVLLPAVLVPLVFFSHLATIRHLVKKG